MKNICLLFTLLCLIQFSLNDEVIITMEVEGEGIDRSSITCTESLYSFKIPVTNIKNWDFEEQLKFPIPLVEPAGKSVICILEAPDLLTASEDLYLSCTLDASSNVLYHSKVSFSATYEWQNVVITNWDETVGADPVVSENAICPENYVSYDLVDLKFSSDQCNIKYPSCHHVHLKGKIIDNTHSMQVNSDFQERFRMYMTVDEKDADVSCQLTKDLESDSDDAGLFQCVFKGTNSFFWNSQIRDTESEKMIYIQGLGDFIAFQVTCPYDYEFTSLTLINDICDTEDQDSHHLYIKGKIKDNYQSMYFTSSEKELKFKLNLTVDEKQTEVSCELTKDEESSSNNIGFLHCLVKGTKSIKWNDQVAITEKKDTILIRNTEGFEFNAKCPPDDSDNTDNSDKNSASWFKFKGFFLLILFLI